MQQENTKAKKSKLKIAIIAIAVAVVIAAVAVGVVIPPLVQYNNAVSFMEQGKYEDALAIFEGLGQYKDSAEKIKECKEGIADRPYQEALELLEQKKYRQAFDAFKALDGYKDSKDYTWGFFTLPEKTVYTNPDGTTVTTLFEYEFNDNGDLTKELRTTIDENGKSKTTVAYEKIYDANGNVQSIVAKEHNSETKYVFNYSDGKIVTMEEYDRLLDRLYTTTRYEYDQNGTMIKSVKYDNVTTYYDADGKKIKYEYTYRSVPAKPGDPHHKCEEYKYDHMGNVVEMICTVTDSDGKSEVTRDQYTYAYDNSGNMLNKIYTVYDKNQISTEKYKANYTYDQNGRVFKYEIEVDGTITGTVTYRYDQNGRLLTEMDSRNFSGQKHEATYEYDQNGNMTKSTTVYYDIDTGEEVSTVTQSIIYSHDDQVADTTKIHDANKNDGYTYQIFGEKVYFDRFHFMLAKEIKQYMYMLRNTYYS